MNIIKSMMCIAFALTVIGGAGAQSQSAQVPDVTGVTVALAAARLNAAGFALGTEHVQLWSPALDAAPGTVIMQAIAPGTTIETGSTVDITVVRRANLVAVYDDNDLTLINQGDSPVDVSRMVIWAGDGAGASFAMARLVQTLLPQRCVQVWAISRGGPKEVAGCVSVQYWLSTTDSQDHAWTPQGGSTQFSIMEEGSLRAICPVSPAGRCEFHAGDATAETLTPYVHFAYTEDWFVVRNTSDDQWMPLNDLILFNYNTPQPGLGVPLGDPALYTTLNPLGRAGQLAPGQCLVFHSQSIEVISADLPQCLIMGVLQTDSTVRFWGAAFELNSVSDGQRRACPAATPERITVCIMPR